jgi:hypothetical protein
MLKPLLAALVVLAVAAAPASADWSSEEPSLDRSVASFYTQQGELHHSSWTAPAAYDEGPARAAYAVYGEAGAGAVMARAYARSLSTVDLQADCWAGAWLAERVLDTEHPITFPSARRVVDEMIASEGEQHALAAIAGFLGYRPHSRETPCADPEGLQAL